MRRATSLRICVDHSVPAEKAAHHSAEQRKAASTSASPSASAAAIIAAAAASAAAAAVAARMAFGFFVAALKACDDLGKQGLVLELVEISAGGIAACRLPSPDHRAGLVVELARDLGIEAKTGQPALHIATLTAIEPDGPP